MQLYIFAESMYNCDMDRFQIFSYINEKYGVQPEFLWAKTPNTGVFRHAGNNKWFAAVLDVKKCNLGLQGDEIIDILDLKCEPALVDILIQRDGILPGYHMNKEHWVTILFDGSVPDEEIYGLIDLSFELTKPKVKKKTAKNDF